MPDFSLELDLRRACGDAALVIGLDESGRGPWAGPVVAAAVWLDPRRCPRRALARLNDCKALAPPVRAELYEFLLSWVREGRAALGVGQASAAEVDALNVLQASLRAMARAAEALAAGSGLAPIAALVDGPHAPMLACPARAVVEGDRLSLSIAAASIAAKVVRDGLMEDLARRYPGYGWERNKGYGTPEHRAALAALGVSAEHRRSFAPVRAALAARAP